MVQCHLVTVVIQYKWNYGLTYLNFYLFQFGELFKKDMGCGLVEEGALLRVNIKVSEATRGPVSLPVWNLQIRSEFAICANTMPACHCAPWQDIYGLASQTVSNHPLNAPFYKLSWSWCLFIETKWYLRQSWTTNEYSIVMLGIQEWHLNILNRSLHIIIE